MACLMAKTVILFLYYIHSFAQIMEERMANWIGHILCRNCLITHVIEGKIEGKNISDG